MAKVCLLLLLLLLLQTKSCTCWLVVLSKLSRECMRTPTRFRQIIN